MIRVNLMGSKTGGPEGMGTPTFSGDADKEAAKKVFTMIFFALLLYGYETYNINNLTDELRQISNRASQISAEVAKKKSLTKDAQKMQDEIKEIESKIEVIKKLSKARLRELKAFDTIQSIIPEKVWFQSLNYKEQKLEISGFAVDDNDLTTFLKSLQERPYFSKVILKKASDVQKESGVVKDFLITCNVEAGE